MNFLQAPINPALPAKNVSNTAIPSVAEAPSNNNKFSLFGPISRKYCWWFYLLEIACMVLFLLALLSIITLLFYGKRNELVLPLVFSSIVYLAMYLQNRLLHNMCIQSI